MNLKLATTRAVAQTQQRMKQQAPTLMTVAGLAGMGVTIFLTAKATLKAAEVLPEMKKGIAEIRETEVDEDFTKEEKVQNLAKAYGAAAQTLGRIYGPTFLTGSISVALIISGHGMLKRREASLVAAYAALDAGYRAYRKRVQEEIGVEREQVLFRGPKMVEVDRADGEKILILDPAENMPSPYSRFFDESNPNWSKTPEYNLMFLRTQQQYFNDRLQAHGFVFLNEVYEALGIERTQTGQVVGWKAEKTGLNDGFVDFGIYDISDPNCRAFVNGHEASILLDFNVDGVIRI